MMSTFDEFITTSHMVYTSNKSTPTGHVICKLGLSDEMRSRAIPYRKGACWRDAMGDDSVASMLRPMMMGDCCDCINYLDCIDHL